METVVVMVEDTAAEVTPALVKALEEVTAAALVMAAGVMAGGGVEVERRRAVVMAVRWRWRRWRWRRWR